MSDTLSLRFLYKTTLGRAILKVLVQPKISKAAGVVLSSGLSRYLVPYFMRKNEISLDDIEIPKGGFKSFNDFFTRKRKNACLEVAEDRLISPCDGFLSLIKIKEDTVYDVKNTKYSLSDLLQDDELAEQFQDGIAMVFRLTPANYHRYCYPAKGEIVSERNIPGELHCVRPIALRTIPVFVQNSREYQVVQTERFGKMVQMEVGALLVGKIENHSRIAGETEVFAGEEKGYFEFGGSTIILLFQKDTIRINRKFCSKDFGEVPVKMGDLIAKIK